MERRPKEWKYEVRHIGHVEQLPEQIAREAADFVFGKSSGQKISPMIAEYVRKNRNSSSGGCENEDG